jgi:hypothetical protein
MSGCQLFVPSVVMQPKEYVLEFSEAKYSTEARDMEMTVFRGRQPEWDNAEPVMDSGAPKQPSLAWPPSQNVDSAKQIGALLFFPAGAHGVRRSRHA